MPKSTSASNTGNMYNQEKRVRNPFMITGTGIYMYKKI